MKRSVRTHRVISDNRSIVKAASILRKGGIVAFPTETVYGLGADVFNRAAVCRVFEAKKRPSFDPLIVHVSDPDQVSLLWKEIPEEAKLLMDRFWPGPLSLVLAKKKTVPDIVTSGLPAVAVRMPDHPVALALIKALGRPVAAPSANLFGKTSPTTAAATARALRGRGIAMILDGGRAEVGVESTVLKIESGRCVLLRPGGVPTSAIERVLRKKVTRLKKRRVRPESPGDLESHYAPDTPVIVMDSENAIEEALKKNHRREKALRLAVLRFSKKPPATAFAGVVLSPRRDLKQAASNLFEALSKLDKIKPDFILAEKVPTREIGEAVNDRLWKASGANVHLKSFIKNLTQERK